jgi:predicted LPLAT superfamily acyltransferase
MTDAVGARKITVRKRGNALGFWFFTTSLRCLGLRAAYGLLVFVCLHYLLFDRAAVRASLAYVRRRFPGHGWWRQRWDVYRLLKLSNQAGNISIISPESALGGVVEIMDALKTGGIVSIMGDRSYSFSSVEVQFMGDPARFSCGAFHIAALAGCPVVALLAAKTGVSQYEVNVAGVYRPRYQDRSTKQVQLQQWVQTFAGVMKAYVEKYPYQCFLFYDIWGEASGR